MYDTDNIFAKILRQEIPCHKIYEDNLTFAFLDIMPRSDGHTLVIPKAPARNILDVQTEDLVSVIKSVQMLGNVALKAFNATGLTIQQFNEPSGGQEVYHLHFHILPRYDGVALRPPGIMAENDVLAEHAKKFVVSLSE